MDDVMPPSIGIASDAGAAATAAAPPSKRLRTQTGAVAVASAAMTEEHRTSSSGMQGGVGKLHSCIVKVRLCDQNKVQKGQLCLDDRTHHVC